MGRPRKAPDGVCAVCGKPFRRRHSRSVTCSRSCSGQYTWRNPLTAARRRHKMKERASDEVGRKRRRDMANERWARPGERQRMSDLQSQIWTMDKRLRQALNGRIIAERPAVKEKHAAAVRSPAARARVSEQMRRRWATDHHYRALMIATARQYHRDPANKQKFSELMRRLWADPVHRMKRRNLKSTARAARQLMGAIDKAIPAFLPDAMRADIRQDVMIALLEGRAEFSALDKAIAACTSAYRKMYPDLHRAPLSLDAPAFRGEDSPALIDTIPSDAEHF